MKLVNIGVRLLLALLLVVGLGVVGSQPVEAAAVAHLYIDVDTNTAGIQSSLTVQPTDTSVLVDVLVEQSSNGLSNVDVNILYDQTKISANSTVRGADSPLNFEAANVLGQDDGVNARPDGAEDLLLDPADGQHPPGERDLAGHRDVVACRPLRQRRDEGGGHRDAGRRAVLGDGAGGVAGPAERHAQRPVHGGNQHRGVRLPAAPLRAGRPGAL